MLQHLAKRSLRLGLIRHGYAQPFIASVPAYHQIVRHATGGRAKRKAPVVRKLERRVKQTNTTTNTRWISGDDNNSQADVEARLLVRLAELQLRGTIRASPQACVGFCKEFAATFDYERMVEPASAPVFRSIMVEHEVNEDDVAEVALAVAQIWQPRGLALTTQILLALSRAGHAKSTIIVLSLALEGFGAFQGPAVAHAKAHFRELVNSPDMQQGNMSKGAVEIMVLEGKIAINEGHDEYALQVWNRALRTCLENESSFHNKRPEATYLGISRLDAPWVELFAYHSARSKKSAENLNAAIEVAKMGARLDDPLAHYWCSHLERELDGSGQHKATSEWLYHVTKAAASGHPAAAYDLAMFYSQSGWKYLADEPPDKVKPTPFDSYPSAMQKTATSWLDSVYAMFKSSPTSTLSESEQMFYSAAYPKTARARYNLAWEWAEVAMSVCYLPAFLLAARMCLEKTLWSRATAPPETIALHPRRYTYTTEAVATLDFERTKEEEWLNKIYEGKSDPPNHRYSEQKARELLNQVFIGYEAFSRFGSDGKATDQNGMTSINSAHPEHQKWFRTPESRDIYGGQVDQIIESARQICDQRGWTMVDPSGGLLYRPRSIRAETQAT